MTQVTDSYQVPSHPTGIAMRTQLNEIVLTVLTDSSGPTEPIETYPLMLWGNTTTNRLMRRNSTDDTWIDIGPLNDFLGDLRTAINNANTTAANKVAKAGDTMTGNLTMKGSNVMYQYASGASAGYSGAYGTGGAGSGIGFVNAAFTAWNLQVNDDGSVVVRGALNVGGPINGIADSALAIRQGANAGSTRMVFNWNDRGDQPGYLWGGADGANMYVFPPSRLSVNYANSAGSVNGVNNPAWNGSQCPWASGISESSQWAAGSGAAILDTGNPWVVEGVRTQSGPGWCWFRIVWLRNQ